VPHLRHPNNQLKKKPRTTTPKSFRHSRPPKPYPRQSTLIRGRSLAWPLFAEVLCIVGALNREVRFDRKEVGEGVALLVRELAAKTVRAQECLPLRLGHLSKIPEGSGNQTPAIDGKSAQLLHGPSDLLTLRYGEVLQCLIAFKHTAALLGRHVIELAEVVQHALLRLGREIVEARLAPQRVLLLSQREVAVAIHPLGKVLLVLRLRAWARLSRRRATAKSAFGWSRRRRLSHDHRCEG